MQTHTTRSGRNIFEHRETYKMLQSLNGYKSLLHLWKRQQRCCPYCGEPIDNEHSWSVVKQLTNNRMDSFLLHDGCRRSYYQLKTEDYEPAFM